MVAAELISVIIPTFNRAGMLPKAIDSVLAQTYPNLELIVVDDGSEDNTSELVSRYQELAHRPIRYIRQENGGPAAARNRGLGSAAGGLIAFLDSDDWFAPDKLAVQVVALENQPSYQISHTDEIWYRQGVVLNQKKKHAKEGGEIFKRCLEICAVSMSTVLVRHHLFELVGNFDEEFSCCEDYDFWLRVSVGWPFLLVDRPLTLKEGGRPDQVSSRFRVGMDRFRIKAIMKLLDAGVLNNDQRSLALAELGRKCRIYGNGCLKHDRSAEGGKYLAIPARYGAMVEDLAKGFKN